MGISRDQFQLLKRYVKAHFDWLGSRQGAAEQEGEEEATREERRVDMNADDRVMLVVLNILPEGSHAMLERSCGESQSPSQTTLTADKFETVRLRIRPHLRWVIPMCRCGCGGRPYPYTRAGRQAILDHIKFGRRRL